MKVKHAALGDVDNAGGEFWVSNPWLFEEKDFNLSMYEHNCLFLNQHGKHFLDITRISRADINSDSRSVAVGDLNNDGMDDLIVRNIGGGPIWVFLNRFPEKNYLKVSLRGTRSNAQGIGARLVCTVGGHEIYRDLFPHNTYFSQNAPEIIFGLGNSTAVEKLRIRWPSGQVQELTDLPINRHILVTEGDAQPITILPTR